VGVGPSGVAYVVLMRNDGGVYLRSTEDRGGTWSDPVTVGQTDNPTSGLSLETFNDDVYVGFATAGAVAVARNHTRGAGSFEITSVSMGIAFFDLLYDAALGTLVVAADTPTFHVRTSTDAGVSFTDEVNPPGQEFYSDWAIGNGSIFAVGVNLSGQGDATRLYLIPSSAPTTSTFVDGLPAVGTAQSRSVAADHAGNAYVASQLDAGGVQLDRLGAGATTFDSVRVLSASGTSPIAAGLPGSEGAAVVFTVGSEVFATIQAY
jgi:hypothetical protein